MRTARETLAAFLSAWLALAPAGAAAQTRGAGAPAARGPVSAAIARYFEAPHPSAGLLRDVFHGLNALPGLPPETQREKKLAIQALQTAAARLDREPALEADAAQRELASAVEKRELLSHPAMRPLIGDEVGARLAAAAAAYRARLSDAARSRLLARAEALARAFVSDAEPAVDATAAQPRSSPPAWRLAPAPKAPPSRLSPAAQTAALREWRQGRSVASPVTRRWMDRDLGAKAPAQDYLDLDRRLAAVEGSASDREAIRARTAAVVAREDAYRALSAEALRAKTRELRTALSNGTDLDALLPDAFASAREAIARALGKRPYVEQVAAAVALHLGRATQQRTGEGKTISIAMAAYLNALSGPVDVYTYNEYLALRDADEVGRVMSLLDVSVGASQAQRESYLFGEPHGARDRYNGHMGEVSRETLYREAEIVYGTHHGFVFDYLFDHVYTDERRFTLKHRPGHFAIVDEADAALLEEAITEFIIQSPSADAPVPYAAILGFARGLTEGEHFRLDRVAGHVAVTPETLAAMARDKALVGVPHRELFLRNALQALHVYRADRDYVKLASGIVPIDRHTGRIQHGRIWEGGLHQFLELKEGLRPTPPSRIGAHVSVDNFMSRYPKISAITGTVGNSAAEFERVYGLPSIGIPRHRPSARVDHPDRLFRTRSAKTEALLDEAVAMQARGRPVLIGSKDIAESLLLGERLAARKAPFQLLNGLQRESEKLIVERAGAAGTITVATPLSGRGTDISPDAAALAAGGLHVIDTARAATLRVDDQLRGRAGRQGRPGSSRQYLSLEDELLQRFLAPHERAFLERHLERSGEGAEVTDPAAVALLTAAQRRAEEHEEAGRESTRRRDALLQPLRLAYFALRNSLFAGRLVDERLAAYGFRDEDVAFRRVSVRDYAVQTVSKAWEEFTARRAELLRAETAEAPVDASRLEALFRETVLAPLRAALAPRRRLFAGLKERWAAWVGGGRAEETVRTGFPEDRPEAPAPRSDAAEGYAALKRGAYPEALARLSAALERDPSDARLALARSWTLSKLGRLDEARADFARGWTALVTQSPPYRGFLLAYSKVRNRSVDHGMIARTMREAWAGAPEAAFRDVALRPGGAAELRPVEPGAPRTDGGLPPGLPYLEEEADGRRSGYRSLYWNSDEFRAGSASGVRWMKQGEHVFLARSFAHAAWAFFEGANSWHLQEADAKSSAFDFSVELPGHEARLAWRFDYDTVRRPGKLLKKEYDP